MFGTKAKPGGNLLPDIEKLQGKLRDSEAQVEAAKKSVAVSSLAFHSGAGAESDLEAARVALRDAEIRADEIRLAIAQARQNAAQAASDATLAEFDRRCDECRREGKSAAAYAKGIDQNLRDLQKNMKGLLKHRKAQGLASPVSLTGFPQSSFTYASPGNWHGLLELWLMAHGLKRAHALFDARSVKNFAETLSDADRMIEAQLFKPAREQKAPGQ